MKSRRDPMRRRLSRKTQGAKSKRRKAASAAKTRSSNPVPATRERQFAPQPPSASAELRKSARPHDIRGVAEWLDSGGSSRALMDLAHDAIIIRDPASRIVSWNASAAQLYGWSRSEAVGQVTHVLLDTIFPASQEIVDGTLLGRGYWEGELRHRRKDGTRILVESRMSLLRDPHGKPLLIKEINRDITQQRSQLNYLRLLSEVGACVNEAPTVEEALRRSLASICLQTNWCSARVCRVALDTNVEVEGSSVWFSTDEKRMARFRETTDATPRLPREQRMSERVLKNGAPVWIPSITRDSSFAAVAEALAAGLHCAYGFAIPLRHESALVITLFSDAPVELDQEFAGTMQGVARHLSRFFERVGADESQRALSVALMRAQDDERRRIARELHDSTGQYLSALALAIDAARSHEDGVPAATVRKLEEATEIIDRCSAELRTLSHLLHPPLLEELGLASAANWYVAGFAERSGVKIDAQIPAQMARFEPTAELTLFRTLQECLTNIHRHSGSKTASVKLEANGDRLILEVRDEGKGIDQEIVGSWVLNKKRPGVGITGMRERMKDLSGTLEIESNSAGTLVRATIPVRRRPSATAASENAAPDTVDRRHVKSVGVSTVS